MPEQDGGALVSRLLRALLDLFLGQSAERVVNYDRGEVAHAERVALHLCLVQEFRSDDNCRGAAGGFQSDAVMRTARRARPSVADRGHHDVVIGSDGRDQRRVGFLGEVLLAVVVHCGKRGFLLQFRHGLAQQAVGVPFGIV
jgi:hypothetical protein